MPQGDYLTKRQFGTHADPIDQAAADWLEQHVCEAGENVAKALGELIRRTADDAARKAILNSEAK